MSDDRHSDLAEERLAELREMEDELWSELIWQYNRLGWATVAHELGRDVASEISARAAESAFAGGPVPKKRRRDGDS